MRILYLHQYFATPAGSTGTRSYELSRRWVSWGHEVKVITTRAADASLPKSGTFTTSDGVAVQVVGVEYQQGFGFLRRVAAFCSFAAKSSWLVLFGDRYDLIVATSTPLTIALPALVGRWLRRMPLVFEVRDVWPDAAVDAGVLKNPALIWLAGLLERATYRSSAAVVALSTGMRERIRARVPASTSIHVIPNASDLDAFAPSPELRESARESLNLHGKFVVVYTGTLGTANDVPHLVKIMKLTASDERVHWLVAGSGNRSEEIQQGISRGDFTNVTLLGPLPKTELRRVLASADLGVISFINTPTYYDNSPNKFFDYCAAGLPVLFTRSTWVSELVERYGAGWVDASHSADAIAGIIVRVSGDDGEREHASRGARRLAEVEFERGALARQYIQLLESVAKQQRSVS